MSKQGRNVGIYLTEDEEARLLKIAEELGCTTARGAAAGEPSIRGLLRELAAGELVIKRRPGRPGRRRSQADQVRAEIARDPSATGAEIARRVGCSQSLVAKVKAGER